MTQGADSFEALGVVKLTVDEASVSATSDKIAEEVKRKVKDASKGVKETVSKTGGQTSAASSKPSKSKTAPAGKPSAGEWIGQRIGSMLGSNKGGVIGAGVGAVAASVLPSSGRAGSILGTVGGVVGGVLAGPIGGAIGAVIGRVIGLFPDVIYKALTKWTTDQLQQMFKLAEFSPAMRAVQFQAEMSERMRSMRLGNALAPSTGFLSRSHQQFIDDLSTLTLPLRALTNYILGSVNVVADLALKVLPYVQPLIGLLKVIGDKMQRDSADINAPYRDYWREIVKAGMSHSVPVPSIQPPQPYPSSTGNNRMRGY